MSVFSSRHLHLSDLLRLLPWVPHLHVCDIGFGDGDLAVALDDYGFQVTALEVNPDCVTQAQQRYPHSDVQWLHQDIRGFRMQRDTYGLILCLNVFPFIPNGERARIIGRLKSALKPGGILIISGLSPKDSWAEKKYARTSNQISSRPTGVFLAEEFAKRFDTWQTLWAFDGYVQVRNLDEKAAHHVQQRIFKKPVLPFSLQDPEPFSPQGIGLRLFPQRSINAKALLSATELSVHFLELFAEVVQDVKIDSSLLHLSKKIPLSLYSQGLSLGSSLPESELYLETLQRLSRRTGARWIKLALGFHRSEQYALPFLQALLPTEEALETVKAKLRQLRQFFNCPLVLEHLPHRLAPEQWEMDEATFLKHIAEEGDCLIALNLETLKHNARCFGLSAHEYIQKLPAHRVVALHIETTDGLALPESQDLLSVLFDKFHLRMVTYSPLLPSQSIRDHILPLYQHLRGTYR
jgi:uncharacterized protein (UPF0276 family)/trans-aconitate methyltransferase